MMKLFVFLTLFLGFNLHAKPLSYYPVTVENCSDSITFHQMPARAVFNDLNMVQMGLALDLQPQMVAITGISAWYKTTDSFKKALGDIPEISPRYLSLEALLSVEPDFLFAGWNYGLRFGTELSPENFKRFGIQTLILSESCAHMKNNPQTASMDLLYQDIERLGKIFNKNQQAKTLITDWKNKLSVLQSKIQHMPSKKVFLYDSGIDKPFTSGRFAMPQALISAAGGENIMSSGDFSWRASSWEQVAIHDPELIILVDYNSNGALGPEELKKALRTNPLMAQTKAVKSNQFLLLNYSEITPGPDNIVAVIKIAKALYPNIEL